MLNICNYLLGIGMMLLAGVFFNKLSRKFNVPLLIMFLLFGMSFGLQVEMAHREFVLVNYIGAIAMSFILFSGGLDTSYRQIRPVLLTGGLLATLGVLITALIVGGAAYLVLDPQVLLIDEPSGGNTGFSPYLLLISLLLGAMISSTDAAAVFSILNSRNVSLKGRLKPLLELESGSNDPMAYFLTIFFMELALGNNALSWGTLPLLLYRMGFGVLCGWVLGLIGPFLFRTKFEYEGLYFVINVALVLLAYGLTEFLHANGMMACYICGLTLGHRKFDYQKSISRFSDGVSWLMQMALFICLGFFVSIQLLPKLLPSGILLAAVLMFLARPAAVWICTAGQGLSAKEKWLISWVGLRGAAPIVFATFPLAYFGNMPGGVDTRALFNLIFIMVVMSLIVQGSTLMPLARYLGLDRPLPERERSPLELEQTAASRGQEMFEFTVPENSPAAGKTLAELNFPPTLLVTMIRRNGQIIQPRGATEICSGDGVTVMGKTGELQKLAEQYFPDERPELEDVLPTGGALKVIPKWKKRHSPERKNHEQV